ncbi:MAG: hypothetical protein NNA21_01490 [Nitrospira sp.]|nr:hypothetical protein [Nitrospira sp.]MCP9462933.1 hypothetical protein [Nitrospira sp.]MCP9474004.1 hypothetical protein [Nitrospira sp.]
MMFATDGPSIPAISGDLPSWSLFFARQPEPDLEFTEEELEQTSNIRSPSPLKTPPPKPGKSPLIWVLLLVLIGGGAYVAMEPDLVMDVVGPFLNDTPEPAPPIARKPASPAAAGQSITPIQSTPPTGATAPSASDRPAETADSSSSSPASPAAPPPPIPAPATQSNGTTASSALEAVPSATDSAPPLFEEGQRVALLPNPGAPREKVALTRDAAGTTRGPAVPPGTVFTILDGELQDSGWVYYVRSDYGTTGWLQEKQLRAKP